MGVEWDKVEVGREHGWRGRECARSAKDLWRWKRNWWGGGAPGKGPVGVTRVTRVKEGSEGARTGCLHVCYYLHQH